ncbi:ABC transporter ATP-binding protein [Modestobacter versicolor]|uniref:Iron complex transport system ATP-binding protein n=1 Tax=Modestobacter versicolor TaxID=429133 RepID=A0A839Y7V3_9ACTN|nr:ABC transporter ATP-binding protein [Modestobacter versicolor]MBB3677422.1 iron complex transport system ATP-binding protein [Modestobacter versicolor]
MSTVDAPPPTREQRPADPADLATERLDLGYDGTRVVHGLDLRLPPGRVTAVVGPNGCGKSTLLGALARVHQPEGGAVLLDGRDLATMRTRDAARRIGLLPQQAEAPDGLTVRDLVRYGRHPHQGLLRQWSPEDAAAVHRALAAADLHALADRPLDTLSGGQRQRAWIAMVVAQETAVVLLDEPTSALDLGHQLEVLDLVHDLAAQGRTVVLVLHDLSTACRHADHLVAMRDGRVVAEGTPAEVVTAELVRELYGVEAVVLADPTTGTPVVCPVRRVAGHHPG